MMQKEKLGSKVLFYFWRHFAMKVLRTFEVCWAVPHKEYRIPRISLNQIAFMIQENDSKLCMFWFSLANFPEKKLLFFLFCFWLYYVRTGNCALTSWLIRNWFKIISTVPGPMNIRLDLEEKATCRLRWMTPKQLSLKESC